MKIGIGVSAGSATHAETGEPVYFNKDDMHQNDYSVLKASSAIPFVCHPYAVGETLYYDGALGDPVPIEKAFACGCEKVVLILTKPKDMIREPGKDVKFAKMIQRKYPASAYKLCQRAKNYNEGVAKAKEYAAQGRLLIIAPNHTCGVDTLTKERSALKQLYQKGYQDARKINSFLKENG